MEWISAKDHLPEDNKTVLANYANREDGGNVVVVGYVEHCHGSPEDFNWVFSFIGNANEMEEPVYMLSNGVYEETEITHWMPLPEPPKEADHGKAY